jgi:iron-sulfur cluster insertion protein
MITLDESAKEKITELYIDQNDTNIKGLRVFVQGGGCSGFSYGFKWESEKSEDDFEFPIVEGCNKIQVLIDAMSMQYLQGSTIKFKSELVGANFVIENPNATNKCGCGSSFAV